jgi:hypothetical protein
VTVRYRDTATTRALLNCIILLLQNLYYIFVTELILYFVRRTAIFMYYYYSVAHLLSCLLHHSTAHDSLDVGLAAPAAITSVTLFLAPERNTPAPYVLERSVRAPPYCHNVYYILFYSTYCSFLCVVIKLFVEQRPTSLRIIFLVLRLSYDLVSFRLICY